MSNAPSGAAIDRSKLDLITDGSPAILRELIQTYLRHADSLESELAEAVSAHESARYVRVGHRIKGSLAMMAAVQGEQLADRMERAGDAGQLSQASTAAAELHRELGRVRDELRTILEG